jgi:hypothetical protein
MKREDTRPLPGQEFEGQDSGDVRRYKQMVYFGWKEGATIVEVEDNPRERGYVINGEWFAPVQAGANSPSD